MRVLNRIRSAFQYERASKLYNARQYEDALALLDKIQSSEEMAAKIVLFRANIRYRMMDFDDAERLYRQFREQESIKISPEADRVYLEKYSEFYRSNALKRMGKESDSRASITELLSSAKQASYLARSEFVPPSEP
jgi:tetratricopeptide (TPR) repeat protein